MHETEIIKGADIFGQNTRPHIDYKVKTYDFRRPDKFSKDQIRTIQFIHELFARLATTTLSAQLRDLTSIQVVSVDQLTYDEFIKTVAVPATLAVINMTSLKGPAIFEIDQSVTFAAIEKYFGGSGDSTEIKRELTEIEISIMKEIIGKNLDDLRQAWSNVIDINPKLDNLETYPQFAQIVPPNDMIVAITFKIKVGNVEGAANLCIPFITIESVLQKLTAKYWYSSIRERTEGFTGDESDAIKLKFDAELSVAGEQIKLKELLILKKNKLLKLPGYEKGESFLLADGNPVLRLKHAINKSGKITGIEVKKDELDTGIISSSDNESFNREKFEEAASPLFNDLNNKIQNMSADLNDKMNGIAARQNNLNNQNSIFPDTAAAFENESAGRSIYPFSFVRNLDIERFGEFLQKEHPQTVALVLSRLEPNISGKIFSSFNEAEQVVVAERIAEIRTVPPDIIKKVESILEAIFNDLISQNEFDLDGINVISDILISGTQSTEKNVIRSLTSKAPELANNIKLRMFIFDDFHLLDDKALQIVINKINKNDLLLSLKTVEASIQELFIKNIPEKEREAFKKDFEKSARIKLGDVENAQQRILRITRELNESGEIDISKISE